ncbi:MAG: ParA family protein [Gammaproteobacteria bacterium]
MKILALYSIKGGVGKTAAAVNLACLAASEGAATLLWDLDPQGSSSFYFRIKARVRGGGKDLIERKTEMESLIKGTDFDNLDLLPADFSFRNLDLYLGDHKKPSKQFAKILKPLADEYEYIFLDCPPNISLLSEAVFGAADALISPIIPTTLSIRTLSQLEKHINDLPRSAAKVLPFFSMVDLRKKLHRDVVENLRKDYPHLLEAQIPCASEVEQMGLHRAPIFDYASTSRSANAFRTLWFELKGRLESL